MTTKHSYDAKCEELAEYFLQEVRYTELELEDLAQTIQNAIENWMNYDGRMYTYHRYLSGNRKSGQK